MCRGDWNENTKNYFVFSTKKKTVNWLDENYANGVTEYLYFTSLLMNSYYYSTDLKLV